MRKKYTRKNKQIDTNAIGNNIIIYINIHFNNIMVTITNLKGNVIDWFSCGSLGLRGFRKTSPLAAKILSAALADRTKEYSNKNFYLKIKGINPIKKALLKYIGLQDLNIVKIEELSMFPFNGCKPQKKRKL